MSDDQQPTEEFDVKVREKGKGDNEEFVFKVCIVGEPAVGKTSLLRKFVKNQFETKHIKTVGVDISKQPMDLEIDGKKISVILLFWDLAGQVVFHLLHKVYLNGAHGIILALDLTRPDTLEKVAGWHHIVCKHGFSDVPMILVGTKADLITERAVNAADIKVMQEKLKISDYIETSSLENKNLLELFDLMAKKIYKNITK
jgi:small GTP-binding protein